MFNNHQQDLERPSLHNLCITGIFSRVLAPTLQEKNVNHRILATTYLPTLTKKRKEIHLEGNKR